MRCSATSAVTVDPTCGEPPESRAAHCWAPPVQIAERVVAALSDHMCRAARERVVQDAIETVLRGPSFRVQRELRLSDRDRPDLLVQRCVAYFCTTDEGSDPIMLETLDIKRMQSVGLIEGRRDAA